MSYKKYTNVILFLVLMYIVIVQEQVPLTMEVANQQDERMHELTVKAAELDEAPEDAYIDSIWKKTPGRDGRKVNISKTLEQMKDDDQVNPSFFIYESIKPQVAMEDLPPSPIYRGHPKKDMVAFLVNVSWGTEYIPPMLEALKKHQVKATFFIEGKWAKEHPNDLRMIVDQGHVIGNHAYNHPDMQRLTREEIRTQIIQTNDIIEAITEYSPTWFAPPSGSFNMAVVEEASSLGMETILWTVDTIDWKNPSVDVMHNRVMDKIHNGATILMHPTEVMAHGFDGLIASIREQGYRIGTVEQLMRSDR